MYLPAMPSMAEALSTGPDEIQLTLSLYMAGFALAQLFCGPISDRFGRRPVMIAGFALFLFASLLCMLASNIETLLVGRFLQAFGGATGPVLARAAVRDIFGPIEASRVLSYMASTMALAPALAPVIGAGYCCSSAGRPSSRCWHCTPWPCCCCWCSRCPNHSPSSGASRSSSVILANFRMLLTQRTFIGYTLTNATGFAGLFAFLSGSSFVLIDFMGLTPFEYGIGFMLIVAGFFVGSLVSGRYSHRLGRDRLLQYATLMCALAGTTMAGLAFAGVYTAWAVIGPHILFLVGFGILMPQSMAGASRPTPNAPARPPRCSAFCR